VGGQGDRPNLEGRWWIDQQKTGAQPGAPVERPPAKFGQRFFQTGDGYDQDRAQRRLTDLNLKWFDEVDCPEGTWAVLRLLDKQRVPEERIAKIRSALPLPAHARGVLVDSGESVRAIATARPVGERLVEIRLGRESSFDAWVFGEWVREESFRTFEEAIRKVPRLMRDYLTTDRGAPIA
jgi:hypothetical protein